MSAHTGFMCGHRAAKAQPGGNATRFGGAPGRSTLRIFHGDLAAVSADVLVASDDAALIVDGGLAASLEDAGGDTIYAEARRALPLALGAVIPTNAGRLEAQKVFHAIVVDRARQHPTTKDLIRRVVEQCLQLCDEGGFRSIAFPALATGAGRFSAEASAMAIVVEIYRYLSGTTALESVMIVLHAGGAYEADTSLRFYTQVRQYLELVSGIDGVADALTKPKGGEPRPSGTLLPELHAQALRTRTALERDALLSDPGVAGERWATETAFRDLEDLEEQFESAKRRSTGATEIDKDLTRRAADVRKAGSVLKRRPLIVSLHGIRTRGEWQKEITYPINVAGFDHKPLDYGRFGLIRFILPWTRQGRVQWFRDKYEELVKGLDEVPSVIAHSLGSYIVANGIAKYDLEFRYIIFCGAIVQSDYDWTSVINKGRVQRVLNDFGGMDLWVRLAAECHARRWHVGAEGLR